MTVCMFHCKRRSPVDAKGCASSCRGHAAFIESRDQRRDAKRLLAAAEAAAALKRLNVTGGPSFCRRSSLFPRQSDEVINITRGQMWRYFSLLQCGTVRRPELCLTFKKDVESSSTHYARSHLSDGLAFEVSHQGLNDPSKIRETGQSHEHLIDAATFGAARSGRRAERFIAHNLAIVRLSPPSAKHADGRFAIVGGMGPATLRSRADGEAEGIRMTQGFGLPWRNTSWSWPRVIIPGYAPAGCIDRRPSRMPIDPPDDGADVAAASSSAAAVTPPPEVSAKAAGYLPACEFDGRLSLVRHRGEFRIFARANLHEGAIRGGRFVQTTTSADGHTWSRPWRLLRIHRLQQGKADLYLFHAQSNPVKPTTLLALFPVSQPPHACVGLSFSRDGVEWSAPISLLRCSLGWRTQTVDGFGPIEWRAEDHPVAGVVLSKATDEAWFYVQHHVHGMSMRYGGQRPAHVARYRMPLGKLKELTRAALQGIPRAGGGG